MQNKETNIQKQRELEFRQKIYTVSGLTADIKELLENNFPMVWITGEISNFRVPASKHFYFTLKDENSQISAVMFGGQHRHLKFTPEDGMSITGMGRISLYPPRGNYQIIFEYLEPKGIGSLQVAFEQLKARLAAEGLFDKEYKKPLPFLPKKISVITSSTGAVIHDILKIIGRRFPNIHIEIIPVKVQGEGSENEIVAGLELLNCRGDSDLAILARGGGSLEDLQSFNSEKVARAIFESKIPIISAIGHETDFTIADFVADLRAPTPSAAAELAVPLKDELVQKCDRRFIALKNSFNRYIQHRRNILNHLIKRLANPKRKIEDLRIRLDDMTQRLIRIFVNNIRQKQEHLLWRTERLNALNPKAILARGYSITRRLPDKSVVTDSESVSKEENLEIILAKGGLICRVEGVKNAETDI